MFIGRCWTGQVLTVLGEPTDIVNKKTIFKITSFPTMIATVFQVISVARVANSQYPASAALPRHASKYVIKGSYSESMSSTADYLFVCIAVNIHE